MLGSAILLSSLVVGQTMMPSTTSSSSSAGSVFSLSTSGTATPTPLKQGGFRPQPGQSRVKLKSANDGGSIFDINRNDYSSLLGSSTAPPPQARTTANLQKLRSAQSQRARQAAQINRTTTQRPKHDVGHVLLLNEATVPAGTPVINVPDLSRRVESLRLQLGSEDLSVEIFPDFVRVTGSAASSERRDLITRFLSLEPGINAIDNQMTVPGKSL